MGVESNHFSSEKKQIINITFVRNKINEVGQLWAQHIQQRHIKGSIVIIPSSCHQCISFKASMGYLQTAMSLARNNNQ